MRRDRDGPETEGGGARVRGGRGETVTVRGRDQNQDRDGKERQGTAEIETLADGGRRGVRATGSSLEQEPQLPSAHRQGTHTPHHHG